jgi:hypothetical protein
MCHVCDVVKVYKVFKCWMPFLLATVLEYVAECRRESHFMFGRFIYKFTKLLDDMHKCLCVCVIAWKWFENHCQFKLFAFSCGENVEWLWACDCNFFHSLSFLLYIVLLFIFKVRRFLLFIWKMLSSLSSDMAAVIY